MADVRTLGTMITRIEREIKRDGITADIRDAIVDAIDSYESERFYFNEGSAKAVTTASSPFLSSVPGNIISIDSLTMDFSGSRIPLRHSDAVEIDEIDDGVAVGQPTDWGYYKDMIRFYPTPDVAYTAHIKGQIELIEVSASASTGATNAWVTDAEAMIRAKAKAIIFLHRLRNEQQSFFMEGAAEAARRRLLNKTYEKLATGRITKTDF